MYELHAPLMILTTRDFEKKAITKDNLRTRLKEVIMKQHLLNNATVSRFCFEAVDCFKAVTFCAFHFFA